MPPFLGSGTSGALWAPPRDTPQPRDRRFRRPYSAEVANDRHLPRQCASLLPPARQQLARTKSRGGRRPCWALCATARAGSHAARYRSRRLGGFLLRAGWAWWLTSISGIESLRPEPARLGHCHLRRGGAIRHGSAAIARAVASGTDGAGDDVAVAFPRGRVWVVDAGIRDYFSSIDYGRFARERSDGESRGSETAALRCRHA